MPPLYNPDIFRNTLKWMMVMTYGVEHADQYYNIFMILIRLTQDQYYQIFMTLIRLTQDQYYERYQVVWTEYQAFQHICHRPSIFIILEGRFG